MTDEQLNRRLRELLDGAGMAAEPRPDCPSLPELLGWATRGDEPGPVAEHVGTCRHCSRRLELFRREQATWTGRAPARRSRRHLVLTLSGVGLAAAACLLIAILYPRQPYARYFDAMEQAIPSAVRGGGSAERTEAESLSPHIAAFLEKVKPTPHEMESDAQMIRRWLGEGYAWVEIDAEGRLTVTGKAQADGAAVFVEPALAGEIAHREFIAQAIIAAENDAAELRGDEPLTESEMVSVRRAVDRWRANQISEETNQR